MTVAPRTPFAVAALLAVAASPASAQTARLTLLPDTCCDVFGWSATRGDDVDGDGFADVVVGARRDEEPGMPEQFNQGSVTVYSGALGTVLWKRYGPGGGQEFGHRVAAIGDFDGDGVSDVLVGNHVFDGQRGRATVLSGASGATLFQIAGEDAADNFGIDVGSAGDVDDDGVTDFVVGARWAEPPGSPADLDVGGAFVYSGADGAKLWEAYGATGGDGFGWTVNGLGDVDGDGRSDVAIGAPQCDGGAAGCTDAGYVELVSGLDGSHLRTLTGDAALDLFGFGVTSLGDASGDGVPDLAVGAPFHDAAGHDAGRVSAFSGANGALLWFADGDEAEDNLGFALGVVGDLSGDAIREVVAGAPETCNQVVGPTCPAPGYARLLSGADGAELFTAAGDADEDQFGFAAEGVGDTNGDGVPDFVVGARYSDDVGGFSGSARLFSGADLAFVGDVHQLSIASGGAQSLELDAGPGLSGGVYWIFGSVSGTTPGTPLGGATLPLAFDAYFQLTLAKPFLAVFGSFVGFLDANGRATATWTLPASVDPALAGLVLHHAFAAGPTFGVVTFASEAAPLTLGP